MVTTQARTEGRYGFVVNGVQPAGSAEGKSGHGVWDTLNGRKPMVSDAVAEAVHEAIMRGFIASRVASESDDKGSKDVSFSSRTVGDLVVTV